MKRLIGFLLLFTVTVYATAQSLTGSRKYEGLRYSYEVMADDSQTYTVKITRTNTSLQKVIVMNTYNGSTFSLFPEPDTVDRDQPFYCKSKFGPDTVVDYFTDLKNAEDCGITINCDGRCRFTKTLKPDSSNAVTFTIKAPQRQFYFYEKYWFALPGDTDEHRVRLFFRRHKLMCFAIPLRK